MKWQHHAKGSIDRGTWEGGLSYGLCADRNSLSVSVQTLYMLQVGNLLETNPRRLTAVKIMLSFSLNLKACSALHRSDA